MATYYEHQDVYSYTDQPSTPAVFSDVLLDAPSVSAPNHRSVHCLANSDTLTIQWGAVTGASGYVVQRCQSPQFVGPTLIGTKVTSGTSLTLTMGTDVYLGQTWYVRVFAYSTTGGASPKSNVVEFSFDCAFPPSDSEDASCDDANFSLEFQTPGGTVGCNVGFIVSANYSFDGSYSFSSATWTWEGPDGVVEEFQTNNAIGFSVPNCDSSGTLQVTLAVTLTLGTTSITCEDTVSVTIDCDLLENQTNIGMGTPSGALASSTAVYLKGAVVQDSEYTYVGQCGAYNYVYTDYPFVQMPFLKSPLYFGPNNEWIGSYTTGTIFANYPLYFLGPSQLYAMYDNETIKLKNIGSQYALYVNYDPCSLEVDCQDGEEEPCPTYLKVKSHQAYFNCDNTYGLQLKLGCGLYLDTDGVALYNETYEYTTFNALTAANMYAANNQLYLQTTVGSFKVYKTVCSSVVDLQLENTFYQTSMVDGYTCPE